MRILLFTICLSLLVVQPAWSEPMQSHSEIQKIVLEFLKIQTQDISGKVALKVDDLDRRISLAPCGNMEAFLPSGSTLLGKTSVGVRCNEKQGWSLFVTVTVSATVNMLVASKPLQQGHVLNPDDFITQPGELGQPGIITDAAKAIGKVLKFSISAGQIIKVNMLRDPYIVMQGHTVQILSEGKGFKLRTEGLALNNAAEGQSTRVKVPSGQIISGIAKENGTVEVRP